MVFLDARQSGGAGNDPPRYVAAQLDYANQHRDTIIPVLLGFNPIERARTVPIEGWSKTL